MNSAMPGLRVHRSMSVPSRNALSRLVDNTSFGGRCARFAVSRSLVKACAGCPSLERPAHGLRLFTVRRVGASEVPLSSSSWSRSVWAACPLAVSARLRFAEARCTTVCCASGRRRLSREGAFMQSGRLFHQSHAKVGARRGLLLAHSRA